MTRNRTGKEDWCRREILKAAGVVGAVLLAPSSARNWTAIGNSLPPQWKEKLNWIW